MEYSLRKSPYRNNVVGVNTKIPIVNNKKVTAINFDNAATTPPLVTVMEKINNFMPLYSSVHRGAGYKSIYCSNLYEESRNAVMTFVNADPSKHTVIFGKNTTEAINKLSYRLTRRNKENIILSTSMEHHSNDLPWRDMYTVKYIKLDQYGKLSLTDLSTKLKMYRNRVKLVTITGASNVTGYVNPIHAAAKIVHRYGSKIMVDGAQLVPHAPVNMRPDDSEEWIDYLAFSGHKMYAPFGTGVLVGLKDTFIHNSPEYTGGGTVKLVTDNKVIWSDPPYKEEAGTPNIVGVLALSEAIKTLTSLGMKSIDAYERRLLRYTMQKLSKIRDIKVYSSTNMNIERIGVIPFNIKGISHEITAAILSNEAGISVRSGCFCAQPYVKKLMGISDKEMNYYINNPDLKRPGMVRVSFGIYNNFAEIDIFISLVEKIVKNKSYYIDRYNQDKVYYKVMKETKYSAL